MPIVGRYPWIVEDDGGDLPRVGFPPTPRTPIPQAHRNKRWCPNYYRNIRDNTGWTKDFLKIAEARIRERNGIDAEDWTWTGCVSCIRAVGRFQLCNTYLDLKRLHEEWKENGND
jgi:hypothetical protein